MNFSFFQKIKERWIPIVLGYVGKFLLTVIGKTCRYEFQGAERFLKAAQDQRCILMFWHNRLIMTAEILKRTAPTLKYSALVSNSRDGKMISVLVNSYKNGRTIPVPHNARSVALKKLIEEMRDHDEVVIITPDGPRGPAYKIKRGIVLAATRTSAHVIPLTWSASRHWKLSTWDGLMIPKPFSKITVNFGVPLLLGDSLDLVEGAHILENALRSIEKT